MFPLFAMRLPCYLLFAMHLTYHPFFTMHLTCHPFFAQAKIKGSSGYQKTFIIFKKCSILKAEKEIKMAMNEKNPSNHPPETGIADTCLQIGKLILAICCLSYVMGGFQSCIGGKRVSVQPQNTTAPASEKPGRSV